MPIQRLFLFLLITSFIFAQQEVNFILNGDSEGFRSYFQTSFLTGKYTLEKENLKEVSLLTIAASFNKPDIIEFLLQQGAQIHQTNSEGWQAIHFAARNNSLEAVQTLIQKGANLEALTNNHETPLFIAVKYGSPHVVRTLLEHNARTDVQNNEGKTLCEIATSEAVKYLLPVCSHKLSITQKFLALLQLQDKEKVFRFWEKYKDNINVNAKDYKNNTPLIHASAIGYVKIVQELLQRNADPNVKNRQGNTPLHLAALNGCKEVIKILLQAGADPNAVNNKGRNALFQSAIARCAECMKLLTNAGTKVSLKDKRNFTPMHYAVIADCYDCVELLIQKDKNAFYLYDNVGAYPIHIAAKYGYTDIITLFAKYHYSVNKATKKNKDIKTSSLPLHYALFYGQDEAVKTLILLGADIRESYKGMLSPLEFARKKRSPEFVKKMLQWEKQYKEVFNAAVTGDLSKIRNAIQNGFSIYAVDYLWERYYFISKAAENNHFDIVQFYVEAGISPKSYAGYQALKSACKAGNLEIAKFLVERGTPVNGTCREDSPPLDKAIYSQNMELIKYLFEKGAKINYPECRKYKQALYTAIDTDNIEIVKWVVQNGAPITPYYHYDSPLKYARDKRKSKEIIKYLKSLK